MSHEAFLDRPAGARDRDQLVQCGVGGRVGDVEGDLRLVGDAAADEDPVAAVGAFTGAYGPTTFALAFGGGHGAGQ